ncbi:hypothetical protein MZTS_17980, partial [Methylorubrum zatmanii]|nr:hypothetical protein [Methylorubrum zatmanii]
MHGTLSRPEPSKPAPASRLPLSLRLPLTWRLALRELRGGLSGFRVFIACIALGVAAISGVTSIAASLSGGLGREGRRILGGDITYSLINREATPAERAVLDGQAPVSEVASLRAMAVAGDGGAALV